MAYVLATFLCIVPAIVLWKLAKKPKVLLPPGPKPWPVIGNLLHMPREYEHEQYQKWAREYDSDVIYLNVLNQPIIVLNGNDCTRDLLEKRSGIYSSRPNIPMLQLIGGWDQTIPILPYGDTWRESRQLFGSVISQRTNSRFYPMMEKAGHRLLHYLLEKPEAFQQHIESFSGITMLNVTYGLNIYSSDDPLLARFVSAVDHAVLRTTLPGAYLVNIVPVLRFLPSWFPGASFKKYAKYWADETRDLIHEAFNRARKSIEEGRSVTSFVSEAIKDVPPEKLSGEAGNTIIHTALTMYTAGVDTTSSILTSFILAMTLYKDVQKKAQAEIETLCGAGHLPSIHDVDRYPYIMATMLELLRWQVPAPFGVPHYIEAEDIYGGYRIPGGSLVIPNIWGMLHDETKYPDPEKFDPERFLRNGVLCTDAGDPRDFVFGFGRRLCPGRFMALASLWIAMTGILTTFNIEESEETKLPDPARCFKSTLIRHPVHFKCHIRPRSKSVEDMVRLLQHDSSA